VFHSGPLISAAKNSAGFTWQLPIVRNSLEAPLLDLLINLLSTDTKIANLIIPVLVMYVGRFLLAEVEHSCPIAMSTPFFIGGTHSVCMWVTLYHKRIHQQVSILLLSGTVL